MRTLTRPNKTNKTNEKLKYGFGICPICRKNDGFYIFFVPRNGEGSRDYGLRLGCPKCRRTFQLGMIVESAEKKKK